MVLRGKRSGVCSPPASPAPSHPASLTPGAGDLCQRPALPLGRAKFRALQVQLPLGLEHERKPCIVAKPDTPPSSLDPPKAISQALGATSWGGGILQEAHPVAILLWGRGTAAPSSVRGHWEYWMERRWGGGVLSPPRASCTPWQPQGTHQDFPSSPGPGRAPVNTAALKPDPHPPTLPADSLGCRISLPPAPTWVVAEGTQLPPAHLGPAGFSPPGTPGCPGHPPAVGTRVRGYAGFREGRQTSLHLPSPHQGKQLLETPLKEPRDGRDPGKSAAE